MRTLKPRECRDCADLKLSNRLVRTRMPGGVAGAQPTGCPPEFDTNRCKYLILLMLVSKFPLQQVHLGVRVWFL